MEEGDDAKGEQGRRRDRCSQVGLSLSLLSLSSLSLSLFLSSCFITSSLTSHPTLRHSSAAFALCSGQGAAEEEEEEGEEGGGGGGEEEGEEGEEEKEKSKKKGGGNKSKDRQARRDAKKDMLETLQHRREDLEQAWLERATEATLPFLDAVVQAASHVKGESTPSLSLSLSLWLPSLIVAPSLSLSRISRCARDDDEIATPLPLHPPHSVSVRVGRSCGFVSFVNARVERVFQGLGDRCCCCCRRRRLCC